MLKKILNRKMMAILLLGMASGVPLGVVLTLLQAWTTDLGISLATVSLIGLVKFPYTAKFLWAPFMDYYKLPFLGRRRGWMFLCQLVMIVSILLLGQMSPTDNIQWVIIFATIVSFAGASHDVVIDAYRRDALTDEELGFGSALATNSYSIGFRYITMSLGLITAHYLGWPNTFAILAAVCGVGLLGTLLVVEPKVASVSKKISVVQAYFSPLKDFFLRSGAIEILIFIAIYKIGDNLGQHMLTPFYLKMGFTKLEIGAIGKMIGFWATFAGGFIGGFLLLKYSIRTCLFWFGVLQALSTFSFIFLAGRPPDEILLGTIVGFENVTSGMGSAAFAAFMLKLTNKQFSATQYALLTAFLGFARDLIPAIVGTSVEVISWEAYFAICTLAAIPGLLMVYFRAKKWESANR